MPQPSGHPDTYDLASMVSTPFPNKLLDIAMRLPETQLRVVLVVVRWTLGWKAGSPAERRASVSLTCRGLLRLIGLKSRTSTTRAIAALVESGILDVLTDEGKRLASAAERRRYPGAMRFRIGRRFVEKERRDVENRVDNWGIVKPG